MRKILQSYRRSMLHRAVALACLLSLAPILAQSTDTLEHRVEIVRSEIQLPLPNGRQLTVDSERAILVYDSEDFGRDDARPRRIKFEGSVIIRNGDGQLQAKRATYDWASNSFESDAFRFEAVQDPTRD